MRALFFLGFVGCTWGTYDSNKADGSAQNFQGNPMIPCSNMTCTPPNSYCCIPRGAGPPSCLTGDMKAMCNGTLLGCSSSKRDCGSQLCCLTTNSFASTEFTTGCVPSCNQGSVVCENNSDCSGSSCMNGGMCRLGIGTCAGPTPACNPM